MKFVDCFLFSEPHEVDVLLAKLHMGAPGIDRWIAVENTYTFHSARKDVYLKRILETDERFQPFRERITVISLDRDFRQEFREKPWQQIKNAVKIAGSYCLGSRGRDLLEVTRRQRGEMANFYVEMRQREAARDVMLKEFRTGAFFFITDTDECIDFSDAGRRDAIVAAARSNPDQPVRIPRVKFAYDFDNLTPQRRTIPMVPYSNIRRRTRNFFEYRAAQDLAIGGATPAVFEYTYCFPRADILRKLETVSTIGFGKAEIDQALEGNHAMFRKCMIPTHFDPEHWYAPVALDERNAPRYVLENLAALRTGNVNPAYERVRAERYPRFFGTHVSG